MTQTLSSLRFVTFVSLISLALVAGACGSADVAPQGGDDVQSAESESDTEGGAAGSTEGTVEADAASSEDDAANESVADDVAAGPDAEAECMPMCDGMVCGDDGCGGSCGECPEGESCDNAGACSAEACVPMCDGMACGDDGCGGSCGECPDGEGCAAGVCSSDPCTPNPCTEPPSDSCDGDIPVVYDETGECIYIGDTTSCSYGFEELAACAEGTFCSEGACIDGGAPSEFGEDVSVITEMLLAGANNPEDCCFDFDGDGQVDNGVGGLLGTLGSFLGDVDVDGSLAEAIADGSVTILLEADGVDDLVNDDSVDVRGYVGYYTDEGEVFVQPGSFNPDGTPLVYFEDGVIEEGVAVMGPADFQTSLPLAGFNLSLEVKDARGQTEVSVSEDGDNFDMTDGKLGGLIPFGDIVTTLNMVAGACECLDLNGGPMFDLDGEDSISCSSSFDDANPSCSDADGSLCTGLAGIADQKFLVCNIGLGLIKPDIDTDFNGKGDHFSVGLRFSGEAESIEGLGEDQSLSGCGDCSGGGGPLNALVHFALFALCFTLVTRKRLV